MPQYRPVLSVEANAWRSRDAGFGRGRAFPEPGRRDRLMDRELFEVEMGSHAVVDAVPTRRAAAVRDVVL